MSSPEEKKDDNPIVIKHFLAHIEEEQKAIKFTQDNGFTPPERAHSFFKLDAQKSDNFKIVVPIPDLSDRSKERK
jgi:hypothetical protein